MNQFDSEQSIQDLQAITDELSHLSLQNYKLQEKVDTLETQLLRSNEKLDRVLRAVTPAPASKRSTSSSIQCSGGSNKPARRRTPQTSPLPEPEFSIGDYVVLRNPNANQPVPTGIFTGYSSGTGPDRRAYVTLDNGQTTWRLPKNLSKLEAPREHIEPRQINYGNC